MRSPGCYPQPLEPRPSLEPEAAIGACADGDWCAQEIYQLRTSYFLGSSVCTAANGSDTTRRAAADLQLQGATPTSCSYADILLVHAFRRSETRGIWPRLPHSSLMPPPLSSA